MKILRFPDANIETSSNSNDANMVESSTTNDGQQGAKEIQPLNEYLAEQGLIKKDESKSSADSEDQGSEIQKMNETAEAKDKVDAEKNKDDKEKKGTEEEELGSEVEQESEEDKAKRIAEEARWDKHPRSQEVVSERNELREQVKQLETGAKWADEVHGFMRQHNVSPEQYYSAVKFAALCNVDPSEALKEIEPLYQKLKGFTGDKLPDDLQKKVDEGKMELADAKEFASLRAKLEFGSKKFEHEQKTFQQQQQERTTREMASAVREWDMAKRKSDPDYKPKTKPSDEDGKFEEVRDKYIAMLNRTEMNDKGEMIYVNPVRNGADMVSLFEKAYQAVNGSYSKRNGKLPPTRKTLSSNGSSTMNGSRNTDPGKAKTMQEAMQIGLEQGLASRR